MADPARSRRCLIIELRWLGGVTVLALVFACLPFSWLVTIQQWLGMGEMTHTPVVGYLVRSLSALYGMVGVLVLFLTTDVDRYLPFIRFVLVCTAAFSLGLLVIDVWERLPWWWTLTEGPLVAAWALQMWWLSHRMEAGS